MRYVNTWSEYYSTGYRESGFMRMVDCDKCVTRRKCNARVKIELAHLLAIPSSTFTFFLAVYEYIVAIEVYCILFQLCYLVYHVYRKSTHSSRKGYPGTRASRAATQY